MSNVKAMVDEKIKGKKVMVFSKSYCPFCKKAKDALKKVNIPPGELEILEIEDLPDMDKIQDYLLKLTKARSVPRVFIGGECIGGGDETASMQKSGQLQKKIDAACA